MVGCLSDLEICTSWACRNQCSATFTAGFGERSLHGARETNETGNRGHTQILRSAPARKMSNSAQLLLPSDAILQLLLGAGDLSLGAARLMLPACRILALPCVADHVAADLHPGGGPMLWTIFMLVMFAWMLALIFQFQLGAIHLVITLAAILAFVKLLNRSRFQTR
jgi:hypothetical protein